MLMHNVPALAHQQRTFTEFIREAPSRAGHLVWFTFVQRFVLIGDEINAVFAQNLFVERIIYEATRRSLAPLFDHRGHLSDRMNESTVSPLDEEVFDATGERDDAERMRESLENNERLTLPARRKNEEIRGAQPR